MQPSGANVVIYEYLKNDQKLKQVKDWDQGKHGEKAVKIFGPFPPTCSGNKYLKMRIFQNSRGCADF